jgi:hypothetical protein
MGVVALQGTNGSPRSRAAQALIRMAEILAGTPRQATDDADPAPTALGSSGEQRQQKDGGGGQAAEESLPPPFGGIVGYDEFSHGRFYTEGWDKHCPGPGAGVGLGGSVERLVGTSALGGVGGRWDGWLRAEWSESG